MKKYIITSILLLSFIATFSQSVANRMTSTQVRPIAPLNNQLMVTLDTTGGIVNNLFKTCSFDSIKIKQQSVTGLSDSLTARYTRVQSNLLFQPLGTYLVPADSVNFRNYSNALYQPKGIYLTPSDSVTFRMYSNALYQPVGNYALQSTTLTINGSTQSLASNRTWSVGTIVGSDTVNMRNYSNSLYYSSSNPNNYITASFAASTYQPIGTYLQPSDTVSLSNRINQRVKYTDTAFMLAPYGAAIALRVKYSDTAAMLAGYQSAINTNATNVNLRVKYSDTAAMLLPYQNAINARLKISDTASMLLPYASAINIRMKYTDTVTLSNRINSKQNIIPLGTTSQYFRGDLSLATTDTSMIPLFYSKVRGLFSAGTGISFNPTTGVITNTLNGTVTSVGISSTDLTVSSSPITSSGNISLGISNAYKILRFGNCASASLPFRIWDTIIVNPATSNNFSVSYASAGFTNVPIVSCIPLLATANAYSSPQASLYSASTTAASFNITTGSNNLVTVLGLSVLGGPSITFPASLSGISLHIVAIGN